MKGGRIKRSVSPAQLLPAHKAAVSRTLTEVIANRGTTWPPRHFAARSHLLRGLGRQFARLAMHDVLLGIVRFNRLKSAEPDVERDERH